MLHCVLVKQQTYYAHNPVLLGGVGNGSIGMANFHFLNVIWWCIDTNHKTLIVAFEKDGDKREDWIAMLSCFGESFFQRFSNAISKVELTRVTSRREYGVQRSSELLAWSGAPRSRVRAPLVVEAMTVSLGMSGTVQGKLKGICVGSR